MGFENERVGPVNIDELNRAIWDHAYLEEKDKTPPGCRWVTIGAVSVTVQTPKGPKDKREGGQPVCINGDGVIIKGPAHMVGNPADNPVKSVDTTGNEKNPDGSKADSAKAPDGWEGPYYGKKSPIDQHRKFKDPVDFKTFKAEIEKLNINPGGGSPDIKGISKFDGRSLRDILNAINVVQESLGGVLQIGVLKTHQKMGAYASAYVTDSIGHKELIFGAKYFKNFDSFIKSKQYQAKHSPGYSLSETPEHTTIHEIGHCIDEKWMAGPLRKFLQDSGWKVSEYAGKNKKEQLAEAFLSLMMTPHDQYSDNQKKAWNALIQGVTDPDVKAQREKAIARAAKSKADKKANVSGLSGKLEKLLGKKKLEGFIKRVKGKHSVRVLDDSEQDVLANALKIVYEIEQKVKKNKQIYNLKSYTKNAMWTARHWMVIGGDPKKLISELKKKQEGVDAIVQAMS